MKKLDLNAIQDEVLNECFHNENEVPDGELTQLDIYDFEDAKKNSKRISLPRPDNVTNESLIRDIRLGLNVKKNTELLVRYNYGLVVDISNRNTSIIPFEDKIAYGVEGLMKAIKSFDPDKGVMFSSYATAAIHMTVYNHGDDSMGVMQLPRYLSVHKIKIKTFINQYQNSYGKYPSAEVVSKETGIDIQHVKRCIEFSSSYTPIDKQVHDDSDMTLQDIIGGTDRDHNLGASSLIGSPKHIINEIVQELNSTDRELISRMHGLGDYEEESLREIADNGFYDAQGKRINSRSSVHRKYTEAMDRLRVLVQSKGIEAEDF